MNIQNKKYYSFDLKFISVSENVWSLCYFSVSQSICFTSGHDSKCITEQIAKILKLSGPSFDIVKSLFEMSKTAVVFSRDVGLKDVEWLSVWTPASPVPTDPHISYIFALKRKNDSKGSYRGTALLVLHTVFPVFTERWVSLARWSQKITEVTMIC